MGSTSATQRLRADLGRPAGGLTVGVLTIVGAMLPLPLDLLGFWPGPEWTGGAAMLLLLTLNIMWGMHGYYPRGMGR